MNNSATLCTLYHFEFDMFFSFSIISFSKILLFNRRATLKSGNQENYILLKFSLKFEKIILKLNPQNCNYYCYLFYLFISRVNYRGHNGNRVMLKFFCLIIK